MNLMTRFIFIFFVFFVFREKRLERTVGANGWLIDGDTRSIDEREGRREVAVVISLMTFIFIFIFCFEFFVTFEVCTVMYR